jgi:predicted nucleic acid-binding Zn ribbon protein
MPIYELLCTQCATSREVLANHRAKNEIKLLCAQCGGVMRAAEVSMFSITCSSTATNKGRARPRRGKTCGHTHACRCAVKMTKPNPFQAQVDAALGKVSAE